LTNRIAQFALLIQPPRATNASNLAMDLALHHLRITDVKAASMTIARNARTAARVLSVTQLLDLIHQALDLVVLVLQIVDNVQVEPVFAILVFVVEPLTLTPHLILARPAHPAARRAAMELHVRPAPSVLVHRATVSLVRVRIAPSATLTILYVKNASLDISFQALAAYLC
jgi:hypothetical protein